MTAPLGWQRVKDVFHQALERDPATRGEYLEQACADDADLRREVESLIAAHGQVGSFIADPIGTPPHPPSSEVPRQPALPVGSQIGPYQLVELLGAGGMGEVYRARDPRLGRDVALKILPPELAKGPDRRERFLREARMVSALNHPNICTIHEVGSADGLDYICFEYIEGQTLAAVLEGAVLPFQRFLEVAIPLAEALAYAHGKGILHRDLKPANIIMSERGPKLLDFGLAKTLIARESTPQATTSLSDAGLVMGTAAYMSPEQALGRKLDERSDIFSLGTVLYEMACGKQAFAGTVPTEVIDAVLHQQPVPLARLRPELPAGLSLVVEKALRKDAAERYAHMADLAADLRRLGESGAPRLIAGGRRNPTSALLVASLIALAAAMGWNVWKSEPISRPVTNGIAVLPFENLSHDPDNAYFADGIQAEILTRLASIADLKVISRTSTERYQGKPRNLAEIAKQLGVAHVLEGSVQKAGDQVRVNVHLINAHTDSHLWADTYDRKLTDIFGVETEIAKRIAESLQAKLTGREERALAVKPTDNTKAYDAYLRGLAYTLKTGNTPANFLAAQKYLKEAVRLDPKFALGWALLSRVEARGYISQSLQPTPALRQEASQAADTALTLQPDLGEAIFAKGYSHYTLRDYDTAVRYFEQARQVLPNSSPIPEALAAIARRRGKWDRSESYFNEAERLDPRNVNLLKQHAVSYISLRRFPEALRKVDQILDITPDDVHTLAFEAGVAQAKGDLPRASALLAPLRPGADDPPALDTQVYQAILERRPGQMISRLKEMLAKPDPALGYLNGELRFWLGWAEEVAGDHDAAQESWRQARSELESFLKEQPENYRLMGILALTNVGLGDKAAALALSERAVAALPIEKDALVGPRLLGILARVAAQVGEPDRAIAALQKLLSIPSVGPLPENVPLTPALLRLDPMFDRLRNDPRFQKLCEEKQP